MAAADTAPAAPIPHRSNQLAKPVPRGHDARAWHQSTSLMSLGLLQNPRINDQARRKANPLIPLNLILDML
jgi:hypothetical protein